MKIIFLDIDGVLIRFWNTAKIRKTRAEKWTWWIIYDFDEDLVLNLKHLVKETWAKIVISSSWRHDMDRVKQSFLEANLDYDLVIGKTPGSLWYGRGNEVLTYVLNNLNESIMFEDVIENFVMIDDDSFDSKCVKRLWKFVHTKTHEWLTIEKMKEAINILKR